MKRMRNPSVEQSRQPRSIVAADERHSAGADTPHAPTHRSGVGIPLAVLAASVVVFMQIGTFARPLGDLGGTRAADWLDLLTPWFVVGSAAWVLLASRASTRGGAPDGGAWVTLAVGGLAFTEGKGLHLAANSVSNAEPTGRVAELVHLWDESVGHWLWYVGLLLIAAAVARTLLASTESLPLKTTVGGVLLAALTGFSLANTWIEGRTPWLGILAAAGFTAYALLRRRRAGALVWLVCFGLALIQVVGWGLYWWTAEGLVFPEYYDVFEWL
jgi:hypothetical protein